MTAHRVRNLVGAGGIAVLGLAMGAPLVLHPYFWTSRAMGESVPWYFIGRSLVGGLCAAGGLVLTAGLGFLARSRCGPSVWTSLAPALLFLSYPLGEGVNVLLHTRRIWTGLDGARSGWATFDDYLYSDTLAGFLALALTFALLLIVTRRSGEGSRDSG